MAFNRANMTENKDIMLIPDEVIMNQIYYIRGYKVMLDEDLAELYQVTTGNLNKAVTRNIKRFPDDFMFRLTDDEFKILLFQNGIARWGGRRQAPNAFTEQGMAMLSGVLSSDRAIAVNIQIMRIFTRMRQMLADNTDLRLEVEKIKTKLDNQDKNMEIVFRYLDELLEKQEQPNPPRKGIGFKPDNF
ncbi:ORF6N domain-containing protein [Pedobacter nyackensis]|uniref:ORF6N domain-containing protein n=2 Tax=Pedobacter nyackensis TaxID=475255 RepID=A0A1W2DY51_9SPHI|nr:ORF6N domain-containing protein [Pedobacter nyackensis]